MNMDTSKLVNDGIKFYLKGDYEKALKLYKRALPDIHHSQLGILYYNIGLVHFSKYNYKAAEVSFEKSLKVCGYESSGYELAMTKLFLNKFEEGIELYKYRYLGVRKNFPDLPLKMASCKEDLIGKRVLVLNEQGFGDEILFSRGIKLLTENSEFIKYQVYDEMIDLFRDNFDHLENIEFFTDRTLSIEFIEQFDCWIPSGDVFSMVGSEYFLPFKSVEKIQSGNLRVGLTFKTNGLSKNTLERSIDINLLEPILNYDDIDVISLQKDFSNDWISESKIDNFKDTSDIIDTCDIVVTVDTVVAHLSAVKGKRTILIYDKYLDWRWNYNFYDSIEYVHISKLEETIDRIVDEKVY